MTTVYEIGGYWGHHVEWFNFEKRRIWGHKTPLPKVGDFVDCDMQSGQRCRFEIIKVEGQSNPRDMFFADVSDYGYVADDGTVKRVRPPSVWQKIKRLFK
jgi:hypothetical protein